MTTVLAPRTPGEAAQALSEATAARAWFGAGGPLADRIAAAERALTGGVRPSSVLLGPGRRPTASCARPAWTGWWRTSPPT